MVAQVVYQLLSDVNGYTVSKGTGGDVVGYLMEIVEVFFEFEDFLAKSADFESEDDCDEDTE